MKKTFRNILIALLVFSFAIPGDVLGSEGEFTFDIEETTQESEKETREIPVAGVGKIALSFGTMEPYKDAGERDWELRKTAIEGYENFGICKVDSFLNVRKSAESTGDVIGKMTNNNACEILETSKDGKWYKISSGKVTGWVSSDYIMTGWQAKDEGRAEAELQIKISVDTLNVRSEPNVNSEIWTQADGGQVYDVVKQLDGWIEIELDEAIGYVATDYVTAVYSLGTAVPYTPPAQKIAQTKREQIVAYALKWLGGRYVWGGETLGKGVDCSGFTMCVLRKFDIHLSHHAATQANEGKKISRDKLKKGDLVFYSKNGSINHVAMYIGNGQVVQARSTRRGICITDINYRTPVKYVTYIND